MFTYSIWRRSALMHRVQYLSAVQIKPWWQWHCFQWYEYWLKKCIWWQLKLFVSINIFIDYHVSYQIHFSGMNTLKKNPQAYHNQCDDGQGSMPPHLLLHVTCFLLRNHLGMNLTINSSQITKEKGSFCFALLCFCIWYLCQSHLSLQVD